MDKMGNHYTYVKESKIKTTYKCKSKKCNVFAYIKKADKSLEKSGPHLHGLLDQTTKLIVKETIRVTDCELSTRNVLANVTAAVANDANASLGLMDKKENIMRRIRYQKQKTMEKPKVPKTFDDIGKLITDKYLL